MANERLTNSSDERPLAGVFAKDQIYSIPYFQRPYRWKPAKVRKFQDDLLSLIDDEDGLHFMGAVIFHRRPGNPTDTTVFELIDGQQRLTTIYLHIAAAVSVLLKAGYPDDAVLLLKKFLVNQNELAGKPNISLHPSANDRFALNKIVEDLCALDSVKSRFPGFVFCPVTPQIEHSSKVIPNFDLCRKFFRDQLTEGGVERVLSLVETMLGQMTVVFIEVKDPLSGPRIFDSLNSAQEPMTVGDLVRNDVFARSTSIGDQQQIDAINLNHWQPFVERFGPPHLHFFDDYFFPYGLIQDPNAKKTEVYNMLRTRWSSESLSATQVIGQLEEFQPDYLDLRMGTNYSAHSAESARLYRKFFESGAAAVTFPYLMRISHALRTGILSTATADSVFTALDSFLTRRSVCGIEPTGLHAVFKKLWKGPESVSVEHIRHSIATKHRTVEWPTEEKFREAIRNRPIYGSRITKYLLEEYNRSRGGDEPGELPSWIEHVLPQNPSAGEWNTFTGDDRERLTDTFANLLLNSSQMNQALRNSEYHLKQPVYAEDSRFKSTREFANAYAQWTPSDVEHRALALADWAVQRWPFGP